MMNQYPAIERSALVAHVIDLLASACSSPPVTWHIKIVCVAVVNSHQYFAKSNNQLEKAVEPV